MLKKIKQNLIFYFAMGLFLTSAHVYAIGDWYSFNDKKEVTLNVSMFMSSDCPHCHKANEFFSQYAEKQPWIKINRYIINQSNEALKTFYEHLQHFLSNDFAVPTIFFCDSRWVGFESEQTTGNKIIEAFNFCKTQIEKDGTLSEATVTTLREMSSLK